MRRLVYTLVLTILGAIINIVVAYAFVFGVDFPLPKRCAVGLFTDENWVVDYRGVPGAEYVTSAYHAHASFEILPPSGTSVAGTADFVPRWSRANVTMIGEEPNFEEPTFVNDEAFGWPLLTLRCAAASDRSGMMIARYSGIALPGAFQGRRAYPRLLPYEPIWPGFLVNTLLYGLALCLLIRGPFVLRRLIRIKRGRCPKCGYDLRGRLPDTAGCPECGWKRYPEPTM